MSESRKAYIPVAPPRQPLPLFQLILVGLQHVLLMYGGAIAVPLIIGQAAGLSREEVAFLINADLLVAGVATIIQSFGIGPVGIRMPVMMGASFAAVGSMVAMAGMPGVGLQGIFGATIAAGFFGMLIAPFMSKVVRFFPSTGHRHGDHLDWPVACSRWQSIGPVAARRRDLRFADLPAGGRPGAGVILLINRFMRGFWVNVSVLVGMGLGYILAGSIGMVDLSGLGDTPWLQVVTPLHFGMPTFSLAPILSMCLVVVIIFVESTGMFLALGKVTTVKYPGMLRRGLLCDAGASFIAGSSTPSPTPRSPRTSAWCR
jgi:Xanthine/uracil permeases